MTISRVLLHNHSTWSDGRMSLSGIAKLGARLGAAAVVMSEHDYYFSTPKWEEYVVACKQASIAECVIVPGIEYSSPNDDFHVLSVGTPRFHGARRDLIETLAEVRAEGGATVLAHPSRRNCFEKITSEMLGQLDAIEIWNRKADGLLPIRSYFDFARLHNLGATVGMDLHTWKQIFPMWNEVVSGSAAVDGALIATSLRRRQTVPACITGKLATSFVSIGSPALATLSMAETCRRVVRDMRDVIRPS
jgi:predicted metal-dependent phosphoesterase TrpH